MFFGKVAKIKLARAAIKVVPNNSGPFEYCISRRLEKRSWRIEQEVKLLLRHQHLAYIV